MGYAARRKRDFAKGYLLGLSGMPVVTSPAAASDPLYLYNGVALPPFPAEWDRETYPYALIDAIGSHKYRLAVYKSISYYSSVFGGNYCGTQEEGTALVFESRAGETTWSQLENTKFSVPVDPGSTSGQPVIWTNFDLMYSDGTLYVGASEPERITDWDALKGKYFHNHFIGPSVFYPNYLSDYYNSVIFKTEEAYILFELLHGFGDGSYFIVDNFTRKAYVSQSPISWHGAKRMDFDSDVWGSADIEQYLGEEYERNGNKYWYVCDREDIIWSHDNIGAFDSSLTAFYGSEPIPVPVPEPAEANTDNKAVALGCRLGYIVRKQMQKGKADTVPDGALISSDGYILRDCNGLYLCAMKGE